MRLNLLTYYADFVVYPLLILALSTMGMRDTTLGQKLDWLAACAMGIVAWTLAEYVMHRFLLHRVGFLERMHEAHHDDPTALLGTPLWLSLPIFGGILLVLWQLTESNVAGALTCGFMAGYLCYMTIHHILHHFKVEHGTYLYRLKRRHAMHHYAPAPCNYGVTTVFWDRVLGTADPSASLSSWLRAIRNKNGATPQT